MKKKPWYLVAILLWLLVMGGVLFHEHRIDEGHAAFVRLGCATCHLSGGGPNLANALRQYDEPTVEDFIRDPEAVYRRMGRRPRTPAFAKMHRIAVTPSEVHLLAKYLKSL